MNTIFRILLALAVAFPAILRADNQEAPENAALALMLGLEQANWPAVIERVSIGVQADLKDNIIDGLSKDCASEKRDMVLQLTKTASVADLRKIPPAQFLAVFNAWTFSRLDEYKKKRTIRYESLGVLVSGKTSHVVLKQFRNEDGKIRTRFVVVPMTLDNERWVLDIENVGAFLITEYSGG